MVIPRNLLLFTCSTDVDRCVCVFATELNQRTAFCHCSGVWRLSGGQWILDPLRICWFWVLAGMLSLMSWRTSFYNHFIRMRVRATGWLVIKTQQTCAEIKCVFWASDFVLLLYSIWCWKVRIQGCLTLWMKVLAQWDLSQRNKVLQYAQGY